MSHGSLTERAAPRAGLDFFARTFPSAKFICLHRRCDAVIRTVLAAHPWGIVGDGTAFHSFVMMHPWSLPAAVAEYWAAQTKVLSDFETDHPDRSLRVRYEDMLTCPDETSSRLVGFTGLTLRIGSNEATGPTGRAVGSAGDTLPAPKRIPLELVSRVNTLMTVLGYPTLESATQ